MNHLERLRSRLTRELAAARKIVAERETELAALAEVRAAPIAGYVRRTQYRDWACQQDRPFTAADMAHAFGKSVQTVSKQLKWMVERRIVTVLVEGRGRTAGVYEYLRPTDAGAASLDMKMRAEANGNGNGNHGDNGSGPIPGTGGSHRPSRKDVAELIQAAEFAGGPSRNYRAGTIGSPGPTARPSCRLRRPTTARC